MVKDFPKGSSDIPSKENYPRQISSKHLLGFNKGISYLVDTPEIYDDIELQGEVTGSGNLGTPVATTIANKNITLDGEITGFGQLGSNITAAISNKTITLGGDLSGSGDLGTTINATIDNKAIDLTGDVTANGTLGSSMATTIANKNISLSGDVTGSGLLGGSITTIIPNKNISLTGDITGSGSLGGSITATIANKTITLSGDATGSGQLGSTINVSVGANSFDYAVGTEGAISQNAHVNNLIVWKGINKGPQNLITVTNSSSFTEVYLAAGYVYECVAHLTLKVGNGFSGIEYTWKENGSTIGKRGRTSLNEESNYSEISSSPAIAYVQATSSKYVQCQITFEQTGSQQTRGFSNFHIKTIGKI